jgi:hypothetical protein
MVLCGNYYLLSGDVLRLRLFNSFGVSTGPPTIVAVSSFDYNTFFSWRFITA